MALTGSSGQISERSRVVLALKSSPLGLTSQTGLTLTFCNKPLDPSMDSAFEARR